MRSFIYLFFITIFVSVLNCFARAQSKDVQLLNDIFPNTYYMIVSTAKAEFREDYEKQLNKIKEQCKAFWEVFGTIGWDVPSLRAVTSIKNEAFKKWTICHCSYNDYRSDQSLDEFYALCNADWCMVSYEIKNQIDS
jgi:hypothetical protein